ncbi:MAG: hypothetical protein AAB853_00325, partial [Patescibacteria group bacterium]
TDPRPSPELTFRADLSTTGCVFDATTADPFGTVICNGSFTLAGNGAFRDLTLVFDVAPTALCSSRYGNTARVLSLEPDLNIANNTSETVFTDVSCTCGDGILQTPNDLNVTETCDEGVLNGTAGRCNNFCNGIVPGQVDLFISKDAPASVPQDGIFTYTLSAQNVSATTTATNVTMTDAVPSASLVFQPSLNAPHSDCVFNPTVTTQAPFGTVTCGGPSISLAPGGTLSRELTFKVAANASCEAFFLNRATISSLEPDLNASDNLSNEVRTDVSCTGTPAVTEADLVIQKSGPATASRGGTIAYTITVSNTGAIAANNVVVTDPRPGSDLTFNPLLSSPACSFDAGTNAVTCTAAS